MEDSAEKSGGSEITKKTRLLDLQSFYNSKGAKEGHGTEENGSNDDGETKKKKRKRKSRKEVPLSSFEPSAKKHRRRFVEDHCEGFSSCSNDSVQAHLDLNHNSNGSNGVNGVSFPLDSNSNSNDNVRSVPKRARGSVRQKKIDNANVSDSERKKPCAIHHVLKISGFSGSKSGFSKPKFKSNRNSLSKIVSQDIKSDYDDLKEKGSRISEPSAKEKDVHLSIVNNGDTSTRRQQKRHRKTTNFGSESQSVVCKGEPSADRSSRLCGNFEDDEDEENLEQNAARMLSSRFDPSCTGFCSKGKVSQSSSESRLSFLIPSFRDFVGGESNQIVGKGLGSTVTVSRVLRPRRQHKERGASRKRRHFYEILSKDLDAYWVLNKKIKVFWPLDESWYYGLVDDFDPEKKLHHVKYDDRDEEWINLHNERFKLLLLPSEVPGYAKSKISDLGRKSFSKRKKNFSNEEDSYVGNYMDSEPIISWLARSSRRVKCSSSSALKKQMGTRSSEFAQLPSGKSNEVVLGEDFTESSSKPVVSDKSVQPETDMKSVVEASTGSKDNKFYMVYFRRRCHKKFIKNYCEDGSVVGSDLVPVPETGPTIEGNNIFPLHIDSAGLFWAIDDAGFLKLTLPVVESELFELELCIPLSPHAVFTCGMVDCWLLNAVLLLRYGAIVTQWPKVYLEMMLVDNIVGLRFILFEGYLTQAVAFVSLVLAVFYGPTEQRNHIDVQVPVTSIRLKLSCVQNLTKQLMFAFYSFCRVTNSWWLYLESKFQQHFVLNKQLPLSECTYDSIKTLEGGNDQLQVSFAIERPFSAEGLKMKSIQAIETLGVSEGSNNLNASRFLCYPDGKAGKLPPFALSFAAAPTFFLGLHLQLLMEHSIHCISLQACNSVYLRNCSEKVFQPTSDDCSQAEGGSEISAQSYHSKLPACSKPRFPANNEPSIGSCNAKLSDGIAIVMAETSNCCRNPENSSADGFVQPTHKPESSDLGSVKSAIPLELIGSENSSCVVSNGKWNSCPNGLNVEIPSFDQAEKPLEAGSYRFADSTWNTNDGFSQSPIPTGPRSLWHRTRNNSGYSFGDRSVIWSDGKTNCANSNFSNGPKKPRTQVHYTLPYGGFYISSKQKIHSQKGLPFKRIRKANEKRILDGSRNSQKNLELLACDANVLITHGDKGWRECGSRIVLELADQNEWRLAVKLLGMTKYSHKVHHVLQPGSTNRFTHAMMWKGGKDWVLEFPDRSQWMLFKEMHEECYNRNIRAASVKNIPIPGVRLIEECDDSATEVPFVRSCTKYFRQVDTDVEMAMDTSHILYDMDSEDEQWISANGEISSACDGKCMEISEDLLEKVMDVFEKVAYAQKCDEFTSDTIEELMVGVGPMEAIKSIYMHWREKREKKGMPLIRHLQPPLWEIYQQRVKDWEQGVAKSSGCQGKTLPIERPPMFAFCLKPRGLELPNKGSKQRSQKKFPISAYSHTVPVDQDGAYAFGRRSNGFSFGDEKVLPGTGSERVDVSPVLQASARAFTPLDTGSGYISLNHDTSEWNNYPKLYRNKSKKVAAFSSHGNSQTASSYNHRTTGKRNDVNRWLTGLPEQPSRKHYREELSRRHVLEPLDGSDYEEYRLRDASGAARHALNVARMKRERAQKLLCKADEAIHRAVIALMTADAVKASVQDPDGDG